MIKVNKIILDGDPNEFGIYAGYCKVAGLYVLRRPSRGPYFYNLFYRLSEDEYKNYLRNKVEIEHNNILWQEVLPEAAKRLMGANYIRAYDIDMTIKEAYEYSDGPFLYEDGIFYYHLIYNSKHYAAVPRLEILEDGISKYPYRGIKGVGRIELGYVKEIIHSTI